MSTTLKTKRPALYYYDKIIVAAVTFITIGTIFYHAVEDLGWLDSLYFTVMTLATVGYGDITPQTAAGKLFTIVYVILGITIFVALARALLAKFVSKRVDSDF